jgi:hypothetical protein
MILQPRSAQSDEPRISSNQLGEYIYASPKKKLSILRDQKYGNPFGAPYYSPALNGILRSFSSGSFSQHALVHQAEVILAQEAKTSYKVCRNNNNARAIMNFLEIGDATNPPAGTQRIVKQNALVPIDGVMISARPEIVTENQREGYIAFTKLRFSKSKVSADAQEIVGSLVLILFLDGRPQFAYL